MNVVVVVDMTAMVIDVIDQEVVVVVVEVEQEVEVEVGVEDAAVVVMTDIDILIADRVQDLDRVDITDLDHLVDGIEQDRNRLDLEVELLEAAVEKVREVEVDQDRETDAIGINVRHQKTDHPNQS